MALYRKDLGNGIYYNHLQTDRFKTSYFSVNFILPLEEETVAYYTVLPLILHRGCEKYPDRKQLARRLEALYGAGLEVRNTKIGEMQVVNFSINMIDNAYLPIGESLDVLKETLQLLKEVLTEPLFDNGDFLAAYKEGEIRNAADSRRAVINNKQLYAYERCISLMFEGERYSIPADGRLDHYENIERTRFVQAYQDMLKSARIEMFFIGHAPSSDMIQVASELLGSIKRQYREPTLASKPSHRRDVQQIEEQTRAEQGKLVIGYRTGITLQDSDATAFALFNEILGGAPSSKLFMNVRERMSLCYSCSSVGDLMKGALFVLAGIDNKNLEITLAEIEQQLEHIRQGDITDEEWNCAKQSLIGGYQSLPDSAEAMRSWYLRRIVGGMFEEPEDAIHKIEALQKKDVIAVAKKVKADTIYFLKGIKSKIYNEADTGEAEEEA